MNLDSRLTGREEKRLPIMMEVKHAPVAGATSGAPERTITDNMSPHGIRVRSTCEWRLGGEAEIVSTEGGPAQRGGGGYCQKGEGGRCCVGLMFASSRVPWSILQRFNGLLLGDIFCAMRWKA